MRTGIFFAALPCFLLLAALPACTRHASDGELRVGEVLVDRNNDAVIVEGIRELVMESARRAIRDLGSRAGYERRDATRLAMPEALVPMAGLMRAYGYGGLADSVLGDINRGVELAATRSLPLIESRLAEARIPDVAAVLSVPGGSGRHLLCGESRDDFVREYATVLKAALVDVGYFNTMKIYLDRYNAIPLLKDIEAPDPEPELRQRGIDGICVRIAVEEERMRSDPEARPNDVIRQLLARPR